MLLKDKLNNTIINKYIILIIIAVSLVYFIALYRIYDIPYYVPDFYLYTHFWDNNINYSHDGFSALFIYIGHLFINFPNIISLLMLFFMSFGIFSFLYLIHIFIINLTHKIILLVFTVSMGYWYYFYGKIFYDFPFTILSISLSLLTLALYVKNKKLINVYLFWFFLGFTFGWKTYNVFSVGGIIVFILLNKELCKTVFVVNNFKKIIFCYKIKILNYSILFIMGYLLNNFSFFYDPINTIKGIRSYSTSYSLYLHIFSNKFTWDHVNSVSASQGCLFFLSAIIILFILPLFISIWYWLIGLLWATIYIIFIIYFSPGYLWHSFNMGVFVSIFTVFLCLEAKVLSKRKNIYFSIILIIAVFMQFINNFIFYLPLEFKYFNVTDKAIKIIIKDNDDIVNNIKKILNKYHNPDYSVVIPIKRFIFDKNNNSYKMIGQSILSLSSKLDPIILFYYPLDVYEMKDTPFQDIRNAVFSNNNICKEKRLKKLDEFPFKDYKLLMYKCLSK